MTTTTVIDDSISRRQNKLISLCRSLDIDPKKYSIKYGDSLFYDFQIILGSYVLKMTENKQIPYRVRVYTLSTLESLFETQLFEETHTKLQEKYIKTKIEKRPKYVRDFLYKEFHLFFKQSDGSTLFTFNELLQTCLFIWQEFLFGDHGYKAYPNYSKPQSVLITPLSQLTSMTPKSVKKIIN